MHFADQVSDEAHDILFYIYSCDFEIKFISSSTCM